MSISRNERRMAGRWTGRTSDVVRCAALATLALLFLGPATGLARAEDPSKNLEHIFAGKFTRELPNLYVSTLRVLDDGRIRWSVKNGGGASTGQSFVVEIRLDDRVLDHRVVGPLSPGSCYSWDTVGDLRDYGGFAVVHVDRFDQIPEYLESDNVRMCFYDPPLPDLKVYIGIEISDWTHSYYRVVVVVKNVGNKATEGPFTVDIDCYLPWWPRELQKVAGGKMVLDEPLAPGETWTWFSPEYPEEDLTRTRATVDCYDEIAESNEGNNYVEMETTGIGGVLTVEEK